MRFWKAAASLVLAAAALAVGVPSAEKGRAERRMALTIDDLPVAQPSWHDDREMERITTDLLATLVRHRVPAVGFVNEGKLEVGGVVDSFRLGLLERWLAAGLELGNRGFAHLDLHRGAGAGYIFVQLKRASRGKTPQLYKYVPGTDQVYKYVPGTDQVVYRCTALPTETVLARARRVVLSGFPPGRLGRLRTPWDC